jgi:hypothetical protein
LRDIHLKNRSLGAIALENNFGIGGVAPFNSFGE